MKILVLQLARLGDIYLSWPALRALKRNFPQAEITLLTREKFAPAAEGLDVLHRIVVLPVKEMLRPFIQDDMDILAAHTQLKGFVEEMRTENFDQIVNLSFSPTSSYLTHLLTREGMPVSGYSRMSDGYLAIPDDMSAYFYAQVGPGRVNRFHLAEIFGTLCGVDLEKEDWRAPKLSTFAIPFSGSFVACHIGASEGHKAISAEKWTAIFSHLKAVADDLKVILIGSAEELGVAETILSSVSGFEIFSFVGQTTLQQTFSIVEQAALLIGADSAPMHMASLTGTPCLNLSVGNVNFWETGPRAAGSCVLRASAETELASDRVARTVVALLRKEKIEVGIIQVQDGAPSYRGLFPRDQEFEWKLIQAVYQGVPFPAPVDESFWEAHVQLLDINQFMIDQMAEVQAGALLESKGQLLARGEEVIAAIGKLVPSWAGVLRWYQTEKLRIGPGEQAEILEKTLRIQNLFQQLLLAYADMRLSEKEAESELR